VLVSLFFIAKAFGQPIIKGKEVDFYSSGIQAVAAGGVFVSDLNENDEFCNSVTVWNCTDSFLTVDILSALDVQGPQVIPAGHTLTMTLISDRFDELSITANGAGDILVNGIRDNRDIRVPGQNIITTLIPANCTVLSEPIEIEGTVEVDFSELIEWLAANELMIDFTALTDWLAENDLNIDFSELTDWLASNELTIEGIDEIIACLQTLKDILSGELDVNITNENIDVNVDFSDLTDWLTDNEIAIDFQELLDWLDDNELTVDFSELTDWLGNNTLDVNVDFAELTDWLDDNELNVNVTNDSIKIYGSVEIIYPDDSIKAIQKVTISGADTLFRTRPTSIIKCYGASGTSTSQHINTDNKTDATFSSGGTGGTSLKWQYNQNGINADGVQDFTNDVTNCIDSGEIAYLTIIDVAGNILKFDATAWMLNSTDFIVFTGTSSANFAGKVLEAYLTCGDDATGGEAIYCGDCETGGKWHDMLTGAIVDPSSLYECNVTCETEIVSGTACLIDNPDQPVIFFFKRDCEGLVLASNYVLPDFTVVDPNDVTTDCTNDVDLIEVKECVVDANGVEWIRYALYLNGTLQSEFFVNSDDLSQSTSIGEFTTCTDGLVVADVNWDYCVDGEKVKLVTYTNNISIAYDPFTNAIIEKKPSCCICETTDTECSESIWTLYSKFQQPHPNAASYGAGFTFIGTVSSGTHPVLDISIDNWSVYQVCSEKTPTPNPDDNLHEWINSSDLSTVTFTSPQPNLSPTCCQ